MKRVEIDAEARTGRFGAGLNWGELDAATQEHGLAVTGGRVSHTGVAGLTLGSGSGWLERKCGITCESLISAEVVTADGRVRPRQRGREPRAALGPQGRRRQLRRRDRVRVPAAPGRPDRLRRDDPAPARGRRRAAALLPRLHGARPRRGRRRVRAAHGAARRTSSPTGAGQARRRADRASTSATRRRASEVLRPLLEWGEPWLKMVQPMPYVAVQAMIDGGEPVGHQRVLQGRLPAGAARRRDRRARSRKAAEATSPFTQVYPRARSAARSRAPTGPRWRSRSRTPSGSTSAWRCGRTPPTERRSAGRAPSWTRCARGRVGKAPRTSSAPTRPGAAARVLRHREVRAAGGVEGRVRPRQRLRAQPEHSAERAACLAPLAAPERATPAPFSPAQALFGRT